MKFDIEYIEKLVKILSDSELTELTLEDVDKAIVLRKEKEVVTAQAYAPMAPAVMAAPAPAATVTSQVAEAKTEAPAPKGKAILSPMVGTFYKAPSPDSKAFVAIGEAVAPGQVVCIIEAMKLMNEIESEHAGKVIEICVQDGQPVEYGQVLMYVE